MIKFSDNVKFVYHDPENCASFCVSIETRGVLNLIRKKTEFLGDVQPVYEIVQGYFFINENENEEVITMAEIDFKKEKIVNLDSVVLEKDSLAAKFALLIQELEEKLTNTNKFYETLKNAFSEDYEDEEY